MTGFEALPAQAARITNEPKGFNGYSWGSRITEYPSLKLVTAPEIANPLPNVFVYENPGEVLSVNGVTFTSIRYRFLKDRLGAIQLDYGGHENRAKLLRWVEEQYGKLPPPERKQLNQIEWHGENTVITLSYRPSVDQGQVWFIYLPQSPFDNATTDTSGY